jgi:hypothetical protein
VWLIGSNISFACSMDELGKDELTLILAAWLQI